MAKGVSGKTGREKQDAVIGEFQRIINADRYNGGMTALEREIAKSMAIPTKTKKEEPYISFYNPANPLNGFMQKSAAEKEKIRKQIKDAKKVTKDAKKATKKTSKNAAKKAAKKAAIVAEIEANSQTVNINS